MKARAWVAVCLFLALIATLLQIASYVAPMWMWIQVGTFYMGIGLWYSSGCGGGCSLESDTVIPFSISSNGYYDMYQWNVLRGVETVCVMSAVLVCAFLLIVVIGWGSWNNMRELRYGAILMSIITWVCILFGLCWYLGFYWPILGYSPRDFGSLSFPWSVLMTCIAGIIFALVTIFIACYCKEHDPLASIPVSGDSKMALTPTVTNAYNGKKYYVPSPYTDDRRISNYDDRRIERWDRDDKPIQNGFSNRAFITDGMDDTYNPTGYRPRSYVEPSRSYREQNNVTDYRSRSEIQASDYHILERETKYIADRDSNLRESRYQERDPVYSHYIERSRVPAGGRSVLPPVVPQVHNAYTDEVQIGASTSYIYRPYASQKY